MRGAAATLRYRLSIGSQPPRGPVDHDFLSSAVSGLPQEEEEWDFSKVVDSESMTFVVCLEMMMPPGGH